MHHCIIQSNKKQQNKWREKRVPCDRFAYARETVCMSFRIAIYCDGEIKGRVTCEIIKNTRVRIIYTHTQRRSGRKRRAYIINNRAQSDVWRNFTDMSRHQRYIKNKANYNDAQSYTRFLGNKEAKHLSTPNNESYEGLIIIIIIIVWREKKQIQSYTSRWSSRVDFVWIVALKIKIWFCKYTPVIIISVVAHFIIGT